MKEGQTDFLDEFDAQDAAPPQTPEPQSEPSKDVARDEKGRFAPKAEEPATEPVQQGAKPEPAQAVSEPEPPSEPEGSHVPVSALKAERAKRQALEAELAKFRQPAAQPQVQPQPTPKSPEFTPPQVDWEQDPQHYVQAQIHSIKMEQSKFFAVSQSSEQEVAEAWDAFNKACDADPAISAYSETLVNHPHPMGEVLKWHRKQQQLRQLEEYGGFDKYRERVIAEYLASQQGQPAAITGAAPARQTQPKPAVPPSLANGGIGAAAASEPTSDDVDFDSFFGEARKPRKR